MPNQVGTASTSRNVIRITIPASGTTSTVADLGDFFLAGIWFPASMTSTSVQVQQGLVPANGGAVTWANARARDNSLLTFTVDTNAGPRNNTPGDLAATGLIRLVAGSTESAEREIFVLGYRN